MAKQSGFELIETNPTLPSIKIEKRGCLSTIFRLSLLTLSSSIWAPKTVLYDIPRSIVRKTSDFVKLKIQSTLGEFLRVTGNVAIGASLIGIAGGIIENFAVEVQYSEGYGAFKYIPNSFWNKVQNTLHSGFIRYNDVFPHQLGTLPRTAIEIAKFPVKLHDTITYNYPYGVIDSLFNSINNSLLFIKVYSDVYLPTQISSGIDSAILNFKIEKSGLSAALMIISVAAIAYIPTKILWDANSRWRATRKAPSVKPDSTKPNVKTDETNKIDNKIENKPTDSNPTNENVVQTHSNHTPENLANLTERELIAKLMEGMNETTRQMFADSLIAITSANNNLKEIAAMVISTGVDTEREKLRSQLIEQYTILQEAALKNQKIDGNEVSPLANLSQAIGALTSEKE